MLSVRLVLYLCFVGAVVADYPQQRIQQGLLLSCNQSFLAHHNAPALILSKL